MVVVLREHQICHIETHRHVFPLNRVEEGVDVTFMLQAVEIPILHALGHEGIAVRGEPQFEKGTKCTDQVQRSTVRVAAAICCELVTYEPEEFGGADVFFLMIPDVGACIVEWPTKSQPEEIFLGTELSILDSLLAPLGLVPGRTVLLGPGSCASATAARLIGSRSSWGPLLNIIVVMATSTSSRQQMRRLPTARA